MATCLAGGKLIEVEEQPCPEEKIEKLEDYFVPRYGDYVYGKIFLPNYKCYSMEGL